MKCPVCKEKELKSCVYVGMETSTLLYCAPYYDEEGLYHIHDNNSRTINYNCSKGHRWSETSKNRCVSCDFGKEDSYIVIHNNIEFSGSTGSGGVSQYSIGINQPHTSTGISIGL